MADYMRYLAEIAIGEERDEIIKETVETYDKAVFHAERHLDITDATRLSLMLNYAVFYNEVIKDVLRAIA